ncbi:MAG: hypothetical protein K5829_03700 [Treponema sp.]|nr:hypothetical protein [Treponema sp.]
MPSRLFKKETDTVPLLFPIKRYDIIKSKYKNIKLSNISFYSFLYLLFWQVQVDLKSAIFLSIFISLIILRTDSRYRKFFQISFLRYYSGIIYKFLLCLGFFLLLKNTNFLNENINKTDLITILIPLLVFNMGAFFILLQFNYQKYSSSYLIKTLINPFIVLMTIIFPAIVLCTTCFFSDTFFCQHSYLCYFFIVYTILSSFILILYFSFISESWILLNTLLASTKWLDFESHRDSIFHLNESRIEAIQSIISSDIKANSVNVIRTDLLAMSDWTNINIGNIAYKSSMYRDIIDNRFTDFYNSIISEIFIKNNSAVADLFFRYFYYRCLNNVTYKNFKDYSIIFDIMFNFIKEQIDIDEKEAKRNLSLLLTRCPYILKKLDKYDELDIEKHITNNLKNIFDYAIKEHKDTFIKNNICLSDFFMNIDSERNYIQIEIDEYLVDLYNEIRSILRELIETSSCEYNYIDTCVKELSDLSKFLIKLDTANINVSHLWDYHLFTCEQVIKKAQEISYIKNTGIFTPFYEILRETNDQIFENTLFLLSKLLDDFFYYLESNNNKEIMIAYWYEMNNFYSFYSDDYEIQKTIKSFMDSIIKKHCYLESYKSKMQSFHSNFTRIEGFNYSKLDIRK